MTRHPLPRFVALGVLLYAARMALPEDVLAPEQPIVVSAAQVERLRGEWLQDMRRAPDAVELERLVRRHADEEALLREALRLGLDRSDRVVRARLVQNLRFARGEAAGDDAALLDEALALGMATRDLVARRRLVQAMEERIVAAVSVDAEEARAYAAAHPGRYGAARRVDFAQVFVDQGRPGFGARVGELRAQLARGAAPQGGDPFLYGDRYSGQSEADLARRFGDAFAREVLAAPVGAWTGPIASAYGAHFVRVEAVEPGGTLDLAAVERAAYYALLQEREREAVQAALPALRRRYPLVVEPATLASAAP